MLRTRGGFHKMQGCHLQTIISFISYFLCVHIHMCKCNFNTNEEWLKSQQSANIASTI